MADNGKSATTTSRPDLDVAEAYTLRGVAEVLVVFAAQGFDLVGGKELAQGDKAEGLEVPVLAIVEHGVSPGKCCRENIEFAAGLQPRRSDEQAADFA